MDAISSVPGILLTIVMFAVIDIGEYTIIPALVILFIPQFVRIARSGVLQFKNSDFIKNAKLIGASHLRIIFLHIFPNIIPSLLSSVIIAVSNSILAESALSYLGFGIQPPFPSWGRMLSESQAYIFRSVWLALVPGAAILFAVIGFHYIGEGIRRQYRR
jgi:peptide/nickel transport system permease protein